MSELSATMASQMNPSLRHAFEAIRTLLADEGRGEVRTRHAIGTIVADVKRSRHKYGARAMTQLARALGTDEQTLYRCACVAECWTKPQIEALLEHTTDLGQPLSFSHFVLLASVSAPGTRAELFDRAVRDGLSVRRLALLTDGTRAASERGQGSSEAFGRLARTTERLARELESIDDQLLEQLDEAPGLRAQARTAIEHAIATTERLRALLDEQLGRLLVPRPRPSERRPPRRLMGLD